MAVNHPNTLFEVDFSGIYLHDSEFQNILIDNYDITAQLPFLHIKPESLNNHKGKWICYEQCLIKFSNIRNIENYINGSTPDHKDIRHTKDQFIIRFVSESGISDNGKYYIHGFHIDDSAWVEMTFDCEKVYIQFKEEVYNSWLTYKE